MLSERINYIAVKELQLHNESCLLCNICASAIKQKTKTTQSTVVREMRFHFSHSDERQEAKREIVGAPLTSDEYQTRISLPTTTCHQTSCRVFYACFIILVLN